MKNNCPHDILSKAVLNFEQTLIDWRIGNDNSGLSNFITSIQYLDDFLNCIINESNNYKIKLNSKLYPLLDNINNLLVKKDIISICDLIEFQLIPCLNGLRSESIENKSYS